ncbi:MAG TPA: ATP-binding cassette domain-containing protein [Anaerolineae bacterium]|nr:ATP-binding cassette domain-containing protein [Anaerolineae bacterium]
MINVRNLHKSYGPVQALKGVSFSIEAGEIIGLLGPNGAGKTTIIKTLTGYIQPDQGAVSIGGLDVLTNPLDVQAQIGYLPENAPLYPELTVQAYLKMIADLRQIPPNQQTKLISQAIYDTDLHNHLTRPISQLSKGYRQRVGLAQAILHQPKLLILDEPTVGLDPTQIVEIRQLIRRLAKNSTILFSTHILPEVEALCDRVLIMLNGELKTDARLADLSNTNDAILTLDNPPPDAHDILANHNDVESVTILNNENHQTTFRLTGTPSADLTPALYNLATQHGWQLRQLRRDIQTLETVFNKLAVTRQPQTTTPEPTPAELV